MDIGIDLGTTFSVIAVKGKVELAPGYEGAEYLEEIDVTILPSTTGNLTIPSVMWWHPAPSPDEEDSYFLDGEVKEMDDIEGHYIFGDEAKQKAEEGKSPIMFSKRKIGTDEKLVCNGRAFTAREVAARFLRHMKDWAETVTGQTVNRAVVTHPAYFKPNQREETLQAALDAGLDITPKQLMMEPCAAALAYTINDYRDPLRVMTYDLGGGTFDVAVMQKIEGVIQMRKFHGNPLLGGCNFDNALVQWILDELKAKGKVIPYDENNNDHKGRRARMLQVAEAVKIRLSEQKTIKVPVPVQVDFLIDDKGNRVQFRDKINREQYAALIQDELKETIQCCWSALDGASMQAEDMHAILLVGGSSRGKWVVDVVAEAFGDVVGEPYYPDECVAAGAAIFVSGLGPAPTTSERVTLSLDYDSNSALRNVNIAGSITPSPGSDLTPGTCRQLQVTLEAPDGCVLGPAEIGETGQFVFKGVSLLDDGSTSTFKVSVSENGNELHHQEGSIVYADVEEDSVTNRGITSIALQLPRPLFIKAERMVSMAEEGVPLPAKCQVKLKRAFGGPTLDIPIFMEREEVGVISVEDIPEEAGEGCMVVVDVEVTQDNEMRGKVLVYRPNGKTVVKEGPVRIAFPPIVIPDLAELLGKFDELNDQLEMDMVNAPPQDRARLAGPGRALVRKIMKITEEQSPDRQVLFEMIKKLDRIVNPPVDDMDPPRRDFESLILECRELLAANPENATLKAFEAQLDRVETAGKNAYETKNNRMWKRANETLEKLHAKIERVTGGDGGGGNEKTPPPPQLKAIAMRQIEGLRASLKTAREARMREKGAERWLGHCEEFSRRIDKMALKIQEIPDDAPKEQALAQVQSILSPSEMLRKKIAKIQAAVSIETL